MSVALPGNAVAGRVVVIQESYARGTFSGKVSDMNVQATGIAAPLQIAVTDKAAEGFERIVARPFTPFECDGFRRGNDHTRLGHTVQSPLLIVGVSAAHTICCHEDLKTSFE